MLIEPSRSHNNRLRILKMSKNLKFKITLQNQWLSNTRNKFKNKLKFPQLAKFPAFLRTLQLVRMELY